MPENLIHLGTVGSRDGWDIDVQLTLARDLETWEPYWIRPAPMSELPGDGWRFVAETSVGGLFQPIGLKEIGQFDGKPVCVLDDAQRLPGEVLTFTEGRAAWDILEDGRGRVTSISLKEALERRPDGVTDSPWSVEFKTDSDTHYVSGVDEEFLCAEVTVIPGQAPPRRLRKMHTASYRGAHSEEEGMTWAEVEKGETKLSLVDYWEAEPECDIEHEEGSVFSPSLKECCSSEHPFHTIVHNSAAAPYYFVISLSGEMVRGGFVEDFLDEDYINEISRTPTPRK
jgi:hypothetical protein